MREGRGTVIRCSRDLARFRVSTYSRNYKNPKGSVQPTGTHRHRPRQYQISPRAERSSTRPLVPPHIRVGLRTSARLSHTHRLACPPREYRYLYHTQSSVRCDSIPYSQHQTPPQKQMGIHSCRRGKRGPFRQALWQKVPDESSTCDHAPQMWSRNRTMQICYCHVICRITSVERATVDRSVEGELGIAVHPKHEDAFQYWVLRPGFSVSLSYSLSLPLITCYLCLSHTRCLSLMLALTCCLSLAVSLLQSRMGVKNS